MSMESATLRSRHQDGNALILELEAPKDILRLCVAKGSITVDGISLTINEVTERSFVVSIIPHTAKVTTLGLKQVGDQVNLESDLIGKYVERLLQERGILPPKPAPVIDKDYLKRAGIGSSACTDKLDERLLRCERALNTYSDAWASALLPGLEVQIGDIAAHLA